MSKAKASVFIFASAALLMPIAAQAAPSSSEISISIQAHVDVFCRIGAPNDDMIQIVNGTANIGAIPEICNTPNGYQVTAHFSNLDAGVLNVAGQGYTIDNTGTSLRNVPEARAQTLSWQVAQADIVQPNAPVVLQVSISPL